MTRYDGRSACTRDCLALVADTSLSGLRVGRELDRIAALRGRPAMIVSDNGTELTSHAMLPQQDVAESEAMHRRAGELHHLPRHHRAISEDHGIDL